MKYLHFFLLAALCCIGYSCTRNTYANSREAENKLIKEFIARNHINVIHEVPANNVWGEKDYLLVPGTDGLYFHLVDSGLGRTADAVAVDDIIVLRYRRYTLNVNADTVSYWTTNDAAYPPEFIYGSTTSNACSAWHYAVRYMKYQNSEAKIICPSKLGFSADVQSVTPYGYDMKIKIKTN